MKLLWLSLNCIPIQWCFLALAGRNCAKEIALPFGSVCLGFGFVGPGLIRICVFCVAVGVAGDLGQMKTWDK
jgi:hypothetical protein